MIKTICTCLLAFFTLTSYSQTDTIVGKTQKISCNSVKIKEDSVYYKLSNNSSLLSISKNEVEKIIYKNGKTITIKPHSSLKIIEGVSNFNDVLITHNPKDVEGYTEIMPVQTKYQHTSKENHSKSLEKPYRLLKIQAAMKGANIILVPTQNGLALSDFEDTTVTQLYGVAYSSNLPTLESFGNLIADKNEFSSTTQWYMHQGKQDVFQFYYNGKLIIKDVYAENGFVYIEGELRSFPRVNIFQVVSCTNKSFYIYFELDGTKYNIKVDF